MKQKNIFTHLELNHLFCFILVRIPVKIAQQVSFLPPNYFAMPSLQMDIKRCLLQSVLVCDTHPRLQDTEVFCFGLFFTDRNGREDSQRSTGNQNYLTLHLLSASLDILLIIIETTFSNHSPHILAPATHSPSHTGCCTSSTNQKASLLAMTSFLLPRD